MTETLAMIVSVCAAVLCGWLFARRGLQPARRSEAGGVAIGMFILVALGVGIWAVVTGTKDETGITANETPFFVWEEGAALSLFHLLGFAAGATAGVAFAPRNRRGRRRYVKPRPELESIPKIVFLTAGSLFGSFMLVSGVGMTTAALVEPTLRGSYLAFGLAFSCIALIFFVMLLQELSTRLHPRRSEAASKDSVP